VRVYFDSSALLKRTLEERESDALEREFQHLSESGADLVSSTLTWVEVTRSLRSRLDAESPRLVATLVDETLAGVSESPITSQVVSIARRLGPLTLRSLDAIHLSSATLLNADIVCAYDKRLLIAASELGFRTMSPGAGDSQP
jgi:uncharacterized protein